MKDPALRVTAPSPTQIVMTRRFEAPRPLVFDAFTRPELIRRWIGRPGDEMTACEVDLRPGGSYRYAWRLRPDESGARAEFVEAGTFREVDPPARVVSTESFGGHAGETTVATAFTEAEGRTTVTVTCTYPSREVRDAVVAGGVESGARESYARLAELLRSA